jgi:hypothetical protein
MPGLHLHRPIRLAAICVTLLLALTACGLAPTDGDRSLAQVRVAGFTLTARQSDSSAGGTDTTGVFVGPVSAPGTVIRLVKGPSVSLTLIPASSPLAAAWPYPFTTWIARGEAPNGCKLAVAQFQQTRSPDSSWQISAAQLRQIRKRRLMILLVNASCGTG